MAAGPFSSEVNQAIINAADALGFSRASMFAMARIESINGNPNAVSPSGGHHGLFQLSRDIQTRYGVTDPYDPAQNARAAAELMRDNRTAFMQAMGREPSAGELYMMHQQGTTGGLRAIQAAEEDPSQRATAIPGLPAGNVRANNGGGLSIGQFVGRFTDALERDATRFAEQFPETVTNVGRGVVAGLQSQFRRDGLAAETQYLSPEEAARAFDPSRPPSSLPSIYGDVPLMPTAAPSYMAQPLAPLVPAAPAPFTPPEQTDFGPPRGDPSLNYPGFSLDPGRADVPIGIDPRDNQTFYPGTTDGIPQQAAAPSLWGGPAPNFAGLPFSAPPGMYSGPGSDLLYDNGQPARGSAADALNPAQPNWGQHFTLSPSVDYSMPDPFASNPPPAPSPFASNPPPAPADRSYLASNPPPAPDQGGPWAAAQLGPVGAPAAPWSAAQLGQITAPPAPEMSQQAWDATRPSFDTRFGEAERTMPVAPRDEGLAGALMDRGPQLQAGINSQPMAPGGSPPPSSTAPQEVTLPPVTVSAPAPSLESGIAAMPGDMMNLYEGPQAPAAVGSWTGVYGSSVSPATAEDRINTIAGNNLPSYSQQAAAVQAAMSSLPQSAPAPMAAPELPSFTPASYTPAAPPSMASPVNVSTQRGGDVPWGDQLPPPTSPVAPIAPIGIQPGEGEQAAPGTAVVPGGVTPPSGATVGAPDGMQGPTSSPSFTPSVTMPGTTPGAAPGGGARVDGQTYAPGSSMPAMTGPSQAIGNAPGVFSLSPSNFVQGIDPQSGWFQNAMGLGLAAPPSGQMYAYSPFSQNPVLTPYQAVNATGWDATIPMTGPGFFGAFSDPLGIYGGYADPTWSGPDASGEASWGDSGTGGLY